MSVLQGIRHLVWDWNGTLLDDAWLIRGTLNTLLERRGLPTLSPEEHAAGFGFPLKAYYASVGFDFGRESFEEVSREFKDVYESRRDELELRDGAVQLMGELERRGIAQSLLSAYNRDLLRDFVTQRGLARFFTGVTGTDNLTAEGKVELGCRWLESSGHDPAAVLMVGDTLHDVEVARAMGVSIVLIDSGHQSLARLQATGCPILPHLGALLNGHSPG
jgi:phosphoglycolate phosphatase